MLDPTKLSPHSILFICSNTLKKIINNPSMSKAEILDRLEYLDEEISVYA